VRRPERAGGGGVRVLPSVRSDATPSPDATDALVVHHEYAVVESPWEADSWSMDCR